MNNNFNPAPRTPPPLPHQMQPMGQQNATLAADRPAFAVDGTKPLARLLSAVEVHGSPSTNSEVIATLEAEDIVEFQKLWKINGGWMEIRMPDGSMGYVSSKLTVALLARMKLKAEEAELYEQPAEGPMRVHKLLKGTPFWALPSPQGADPSVLMVRLDSGLQGVIAGATPVITLPIPTVRPVQSAGHDILVGGLWCVGGIIVTAGTYASVAQSGGTYLICWGPVIFGGFQLIRGLVRAAAAEKAPAYSRPNGSP